MVKFSTAFFYSIFLLFAHQGCQTSEAHCPSCSTDSLSFRQAFFFPPIPFPEDNYPTECRVELGKKLFHDPQLSADGQTSCASCHALTGAFTDGQSVAVGHDQQQGMRNTPTLFNVGWQPYLMAEGGVKSLEQQALAPLLSTHEMFNSSQGLPTAILKNECYQTLSQKAYNRDLDFYTLVRALACYERSLISYDTPFDQAYYFKKRRMSPEAGRGWQLFQSDKLACIQCHSLPFFTDYQFYSIGVADSTDLGKERESYHIENRYQFKTPTLRNIELTGPYMHNGSLRTLEDVVEFYNRGGDWHPKQQDHRIRPLGLTPQEKLDLVSFLESLTDWNAVQNHSFLPLNQ